MNDVWQRSDMCGKNALFVAHHRREKGGVETMNDENEDIGTVTIPENEDTDNLPDLDPPGETDRRDGVYRDHDRHRSRSRSRRLRLHTAYCTLHTAYCIPYCIPYCILHTAY